MSMLGPLNPSEFTRIAVKLDNGGEIFSYETKRLLATLRQAQEDRQRIAGLLQELLDQDDTPEAGCSCHISPPCSDCVDYAGHRETLKAAQAALESIKGHA